MTHVRTTTAQDFGLRGSAISYLRLARSATLPPPRQNHPHAPTMTAANGVAASDSCSYALAIAGGVGDGGPHDSCNKHRVSTAD